MADIPGRIVAQTEPVLHRAARVEDVFHDFRSRRARRRGLTPTVVTYTGYGTTEWVRVLGRVLLTRDEIDGDNGASTRKRAESIRGWRSFVSVPVNDVSVDVEIGGAHHELMPDRGGVIDAVIEISLAPGQHPVQMTAQGARRGSDARVIVADPDAIYGVISDIDDTVMVTALPRPLLAAWNTFVLNEHARVPTPGMAVLLERLSARTRGGPVVYLSTGAWNVAPTLRRFLSRNLFPAGALLLTDWGPTRDRWFRSGTAHKRDSLDRLAQEFPHVKWILIGDDGQHDEEIYGQFASTHRGAVAAIAIRQLSQGEAVLAGGRSRGAPGTAAETVPWLYAPDGAGLKEQLVALGLMD